MRGLLLVVLAVALAASGCLDPASDDSASDADATSPTGLPEPVPGPLALAGTQCREAGGHSVHPRMFDPLPAPWRAADVLEDVGPQLVWSEVPDPTAPVPQEGNTIGNYHATLVCASWTFGGQPVPSVVFGFVGMKVEEPAFGDGLPVRQYVVTVVAVDHAPTRDALMAAGVHATDVVGAAERRDGVVRTLLDTADHGVFESLFAPKEMGDAPDGTYRLWWQHEAAPGLFRPVGIDLVKSGGTHIAAEGQGTFSHLETEDHAPLPGAVGHTAALGYFGFDVSITLGPRPDVELPEAYVHA